MALTGSPGTPGGPCGPGGPSLPWKESRNTVVQTSHADVSQMKNHHMLHLTRDHCENLVLQLTSYHIQV